MGKHFWLKVLVHLFIVWVQSLIQFSV